ncbi:MULTISPECIES: phosphogluconate dehydrogenase (NAD(+)-dependent, decarboxylating) [Halobacillus]|uniref:6-phosphogluconate dehydrogenase-like protein n=1 Tax=Halobacillus halophilus (strain ATCC 35676 / DSM 2266 / JCM 20832 / KCTC 3685 / LMG 17431 / NBRC 102448 / NCIMB 2269) TaxID=866895 RepID=I0JRT0_HALH3|nr:decarboxylating 6-phosphogluconate dehydrogenase [Halobacillus halophilus]ASF41539.1 6-phosphogluconate dehydrogenase (decarboxylating) [Halobacillus halophilus]CCG46851.1 6-phosphogluconate dehydrogenase-like protein [Halobacillus halophilus DSM 2266]
MKIGLIGLGKMGYNLGLNLMDHGHEVVANDVNADQIKEIANAGAVPANSLKELVENLEAPRTVWVMVPAGEITQSVLDELSGLLEAGDRVIDGGNSNYKDSLRRAEQFKEKDMFFFDVGTSGGTEGARHGGCFMIGGDEEQFKEIEPIFADTSVENGYHYAGRAASGHFLKMVHNGIEYGMMQSIAEGYEILEKSPFDYDYEAVSKVWNNGSVIRSWLIELMESAFSKDAKLEDIRGVMNSSGEGKWTLETAIEYEMAAPVIAMSLMTRYRSQEDDTFSGKVVAALRNEFGGHAVVKK